MDMITSKELRSKYFSFFREKGHAIIPSAPLIPENDPTVLFTTAGMHPLVPYLLGEKHPEGKRLADVQKCIRTQDIEEVGDNRHDTFFEMLGNWSLGDYFKKETIEWSWEFLTSPRWLGIDPRKLPVSVFAGDDDAPRDNEAASLWKSLGVPEDRIVYLGKEENWWGPAGKTGPCGPDTEIFYWIGDGDFPPSGSNPKTDADRWLEIWNDVFMQYNKKEDGSFEPLLQKNVDTGMGLERVLMVMNGHADVFFIDTFWPLIQEIEQLSGKQYGKDPKATRSMRIIADHIRAATMIMGEDVRVGPSNTDQGYVVRRLIRRAIRHARLLGVTGTCTVPIAEKVVAIFQDVYPEVGRNKGFAIEEMQKEEDRFLETLSKGLKEFERIKGRIENRVIEGSDAFYLYATYGFPLEMTKELAVEENLRVDEEGFFQEFRKHQSLSREGARQKFAGGLADHSEETTKLHTATHLLHAALRKVLGEHVKQRGSNITKQRLRFDFSHDAKMTPEEIQEVEHIVNAAIERDYPVSWEEMSVQEAKNRGAMGLFEDRYADRVKVYSIGDPLQTPTGDPASPTFSKEICGGPHVEHTGLLGRFRIVKEEASSRGVRRIKAVLE